MAIKDLKRLFVEPARGFERGLTVGMLFISTAGDLLQATLIRLSIHQQPEAAARLLAEGSSLAKNMVEDWPIFILTGLCTFIIGIYILRGMPMARLFSYAIALIIGFGIWPKSLAVMDAMLELKSFAG